MCSRPDAPNNKMTSVKCPCVACWKGVEANSVLKKWLHKWCSGIQESLRNCNDFIFKTCSTVAEAGHPFSTCITKDWDEFETVSESCYLHDIIGQAGGCIGSLMMLIDWWSLRLEDALMLLLPVFDLPWKAFHELLPIFMKSEGLYKLWKSVFFFLIGIHSM